MKDHHLKNIISAIYPPERANPSFEIFKNKIYSKRGMRHGLKIFP